MTKRLLLSVSVILSVAIATPAFAQTAAQEPNTYALNISNVEMKVGSMQHQQGAVNGIASNATQTVRPWKAGSETATMPWSAPTGHHQPTAVDVINSDYRLSLDQEDARVDGIVRGICRGC
jgi:hypothetical protein